MCVSTVGDQEAGARIRYRVAGWTLKVRAIQRVLAELPRPIAVRTQMLLGYDQLAG